MYGPEAEPRADPNDETVPAWQRIFFGPNTWPGKETADDHDPLPGFRPTTEALGERYVGLHHQLGGKFTCMPVNLSIYRPFVSYSCALEAFF